MLIHGRSPLDVSLDDILDLWCLVCGSCLLPSVDCDFCFSLFGRTLFDIVVGDDVGVGVVDCQNDSIVG